MRENAKRYDCGIDEQSPEFATLKECLSKALEGSTVERAQKRLVAHDAQHKVLENELAEGEARVQRLQVLVEAPQQVPPTPSRCPSHELPTNSEPVAGGTRCVGRASEASDRFEVGGTGPPYGEFCGRGATCPGSSFETTGCRRDPKWPAGSRRLDVFKTLECPSTPVGVARCSSRRGFELRISADTSTRRLERSKPIGPYGGFGNTQVDSSSDEELLVHPNSRRDVVPRSGGELLAHTPPGLSEFRTSVTLRRVVATCGVEDSETTAPVSPLALVAAGMAVDDVPSTIVDAFEMDLSPVSSTVPASVGVVQQRIGSATPHLRRVVLMPQSAVTTVRSRCQF